MSFKMDMKKFKKVGRSKAYTELEHEDGHTIKVAHYKLHPTVRKELDSLDMHESKTAKKMSKGGQANKDDVPEPDPKAAKEFSKGASDSGFRPDEWKKNIKAGLGLHEGGPVMLSQGGMVEAIGKENYKDKEIQHFADGGAVKEEPGFFDKIVSGLKSIASPETPSVSPTSATTTPPVSPETQPVAPPVPAPIAPPVANAAPQMPAQPANPQPVPGMYQEGAPNPSAAYQQQVQGLQKQAEAEAKLGKGEERALKSNLAAQNNLHQTFSTNLADLQAQRSQLIDDMNLQQIKPETVADKLFNNKDTWGKIGSAIGFVLAGVGAGRGDNPVLSMIQKEIDRDVDAQKANLGKTEKALQINQQDIMNARDVADFRRIQLTDLAANKMKLEAAKVQDPMAKARLLQGAGQLQERVAPIAQQLAFRKSLMQGDVSSHDPSVYVNAVVPKEQHKEAFKELEEAEKMTKSKSHINHAFDQIAKLQSASSRIGNPLQSRSQIAALRDPLVAQLSKDTAGRFTEQDAKMLETLFPTVTDNPETLAKKKAQINNMISEKMNFPTLRGNGIDVSRFDKFAETKDIGGHQYKKVPGGWQRIK